MKLYTIGFTKKSASEFFDELLRPSGAKRVIDVRLRPSSQLAGFAKVSKSGGDFEFLLDRLCDMDYVHTPLLAPSDELFTSYRGGDITWDEYAERYLELLAVREVARVLDRALFADALLLCSEHTPERCHRRLAAEHLQRHWGDIEIIHL
ncbi:MAG: DUF488 domain-containing protein [Chloroflexi bacterium]|nr:DUF488 domain-containing protein [Chloroflexota bacterium]MCY3696403.1 DUF488 domain-containing protein [Chloroflexota bacterium]MYB23443.1 DUF488 domain-containing protein [Chloroflexota bacterium]MYF82410.1 DUF488 domain-containing protein [Chloroflexota bacterium]MYI03957.1 DUF488 domain-containing protein [Chloroflexota bacterium]